MGYIANFEKNFFVFFLVVFGHVIGFSFLLHLNDFVASVDLLMVFFLEVLNLLLDLTRGMWGLGVGCFMWLVFCRSDLSLIIFFWRRLFGLVLTSGFDWRLLFFILTFSGMTLLSCCFWRRGRMEWNFKLPNIHFCKDTYHSCTGKSPYTSFSLASYEW